MSRWKHRLLALTGVGLLSAGVASGVVLNTPGNANAEGNANGHRDFVVSGHVEDLRPGGTRPMVLTVRNPNSVAIRVTSVTMAAGAAAPGCPASSLTLPQWTGSLRVPKRGTASLTVDVHLKPGAPNVCQGARWPLTYGGTAVKA
jgi:hypothetical protein